MEKLPTHLTQFIGRQREIEEITQLLADSACRLLTLVGPGGSGDGWYVYVRHLPFYGLIIYSRCLS